VGRARAGVERREQREGPAANTDFALDSASIKGPVLGHIRGVVNRGTAPVVVQRVAATIELPGVKGVLGCYDFARRRFRKATVDGRVTLRADEPLFLARIQAL